MKKKLTLLAMALMSMAGAMAQNAIRIEKGDTLTILTDELRSMVFQGEGYHEILTPKNGELINTQNDKLNKIDFRGKNINAIFQSGERKTFAIADLDALTFAKDATGIEGIEGDKVMMVYDARTQTASAINAKAKGLMQLYSTEGKLVKQTRGNHICIEGLPDGMYIVSYNHKLFAKIKK